MLKWYVEEPVEEIRVLKCPFCGRIEYTGCIGKVACGPHKVGDNYFPARIMEEIETKGEVKTETYLDYENRRLGIK